MIQILRDRLNTYSLQTSEEAEFALKEILQELLLCALSDAGFFERALFHGGTSLRILYHLPRFSEDLDFLLKEPDPSFRWAPYLDALRETCEMYGISPEVVDKSRMDQAVRKMFFKDNSIGQILNLSFLHPPHQKLKIRLEIDTKPPEGSRSERRYLDFPVDFPVEIQDLPSNFATKLHALLCRPYAKGRDWFDLLWYLRRRVAPNLPLLANALEQMGPWAGQRPQAEPEWLLQALRERIQQIDWAATAADVAPFLPSRERRSLEVWSAAFFEERLQTLSANL